jgi:hypothetical protein
MSKNELFPVRWVEKCTEVFIEYKATKRFGLGTCLVVSNEEEW